MTIEKRVDRYIYAYHKYTDRLSFTIKLPPDAFEFLSTLDFLVADNNDVNLYCVYDLTREQVELIVKYFDLFFEVNTDYFHYQLDCSSMAVSKVKTKEQLLKYLSNESYYNYIEGNIPFGLLDVFNLMCYKIYQQGVQDGRS